MNMKIYNGSKICVLSSQLFLIAGIYNIYYKNINLGILILLLYFSSTIYHSDGNELARNIDLFVVFIIIFVAIYWSYKYKNKFPVIMLLIVGIIYVNNNNHILQLLKNKSKHNLRDDEYHIYDYIYHSIIHIIAFISFLVLVKIKNNNI